MKLVSSRGGGRRVAGKNETATVTSRTSQRRANEVNAKKDSSRVNKHGKKKMSRAKKAIIIVASIIVAAILLLTAFALIIRYEIEPFYSWFLPPITSGDETVDNPGRLGTLRTPRPGSDDHGVFDDSRPLEEVRNVNAFTFLILGVDGYRGMRSEGGGNTDAIMIATFNTEDLTLEVASIPRDTIVNVSWDIKKINSIYAVMRNREGWTTGDLNVAMQNTLDHFADFTGFNIDYWITLDLGGFESLIDAIGGVRFNVPYSINMREPGVLNVQLSPGEQLLNGQQAMAVVRDRSHGGGDFTRAETQGKLVKAIAEQLLANSSSINVTDYANLFLRYVQTNMELNELVRLGRIGLQMNSDNINFHSAEGTVTSVAGGSYVYVHLDQWLEIVNEYLSPFYDEITPLHVSILTRGEDGRLYVTDDNWQANRNWGSR